MAPTEPVHKIVTSGGCVTSEGVDADRRTSEGFSTPLVTAAIAADGKLAVAHLINCFNLIVVGGNRNQPRILIGRILVTVATWV